LLTYYFTIYRGLSNEYAAIVWLVFGIWNAVNDPLFGYISDRTKSKLGRRIPYIRFGAPIYFLAFISLWINWPGSGQTLMFVEMLLFLFVFDALYTAIASAIYVMPFEMAVSNKARSKIFLWKLIAMVFSTAAPMAAPFLQPKVGEDATPFRLIMIVLGLVMSAIVFVSTYFYKENGFQQDEEQYGFVKSFIECFKNLSFIVFEVISFTVLFVQTDLTLGLNYYFNEFPVSPIPLYAALPVGIICGILLWLKKREDWGIKKCLMVMFPSFALGCLMIVFFGSSTIGATIAFFLIGIGFSGGMYLVPIMFGDVMDMDEHRTGLRREGMYAGVNSFITKPAISIAQSAFLWIITAYGYDKLAIGSQTAAAKTGVLIAWALIPALLLLVSLGVMFFYPLAGKEWAQIKNKLALIHKEKEKKHLEARGIKFVD
ncbi:MAG: MFS transporter, partial [Anaerolineaceae bacterium]|nr:MFS transporter [Anaerolineaceae bacterium]